MDAKLARGYRCLNAEWRIFAALLLTAAALLGSLNGLAKPDQLIYDQLIRSTTREAPDNIVIVAIDQPSLAQLGRWPWPRRMHAELLNILSDTGALAIGMDIIFSEPDVQQNDGRNDDLLLAQALERNGKTVLPILIEHGQHGLGTTLPLPALLQTARGFGYIHFSFDNDGVVRRTSMRENLNGIWWPQFALAVYEAGKTVFTPARRVDLARVNHRLQEEYSNSFWIRGHSELIPYVSPRSHFQTVSYVDVLNKRIPPNFFAGKYVLIGATAAGLGNAFPTPLTSAYRAMPGVEVNANILAGLLDEHRIQEAAPWHTALFTVIAAFLALAACRHLSPRAALACTVTLALVVLLLTYVLFAHNVWLPPTAAVSMIIISYPLWSWRRLEAALSFLGEEFTLLNKNAALVLKRGDEMHTPHNADFLDRRIAEMRLAANRARSLQQFVIDNLNSMPDATLVLSHEGEIITYNYAAKNYFDSLGLRTSAVLSFDEIFSNFEVPTAINAKSAAWRNVLLNTASSNAVEFETRDVNGKEFLIKSAPSRITENHVLGWIVLLIDVSSLRAAERHREESLNFISHDMRAPQSSILALLELQKNPSTAFPQEEFFSRIERSVQTTLTLADEFVHLSRAESPTYQLQDSEFASLLADAADDMWAFAQSRSIEIVIKHPEGHEHGIWVNLDRSLVVRALGNLLSNAIKFSPPGTQVECTFEVQETEGQSHVVCKIKDQGQGIPESEKKRLFCRFTRLSAKGRDGVGLGLLFVKTVIERHGGKVDFHSQPEEGTTFVVRLPCITDGETARLTFPEDETA